jgi:glucokinase
MKNYIGIDVGGTTVKFGLFYENGELLDKWEIPTQTENRKEKLYTDLANSMTAKLEEKGIPYENLAGVGMGLPGPVRPDGSISKLTNLGIGEIHPDTEFPAYIRGIKVRAVNDANAAALGELWQGGGKNFESMVFITLGTGVGGGVIENNRLICGNQGMGGEIGHIMMNPDEELQCNCGGHGCLEQYASATGIVRLATRALAASEEDSTLRRIPDFSCKDVLDQAKAGDALAKKAVEQAMDYLGRAMCFVSYTTDPQCFVIGGGVSKAGQYLIDILKQHYEKYVRLQKPEAQIHLATLGNDAGIYGAARMALEE